MSLFRRSKQKFAERQEDRLSKMEIAAHLRKHQTLPVAARTKPVKARPAERRMRRKVSSAVRVYPPSRWRALRQRYADARSELNSTPGDPFGDRLDGWEGFVEEAERMSKALAKQLAHPRRRYRMARPHGRQATVRKVYR